MPTYRLDVYRKDAKMPHQSVDITADNDRQAVTAADKVIMHKPLSEYGFLTDFAGQLVETVGQ